MLKRYESCISCDLVRNPLYMRITTQSGKHLLWKSSIHICRTPIKKKVQGKILFFHRPVIQVIPNKGCHCLPKYNTKVEN